MAALWGRWGLCNKIPTCSCMFWQHMSSQRRQLCYGLQGQALPRQPERHPDAASLKFRECQCPWADLDGPEAALAWAAGLMQGRSPDSFNRVLAERLLCLQTEHSALQLEPSKSLGTLYPHSKVNTEGLPMGMECRAVSSFWKISQHNANPPSTSVSTKSHSLNEHKESKEEDRTVVSNGKQCQHQPGSLQVFTTI